MSTRFLRGRDGTGLSQLAVMKLHGVMRLTIILTQKDILFFSFKFSHLQE